MTGAATGRIVLADTSGAAAGTIVLATTGAGAINGADLMNGDAKTCLAAYTGAAWGWKYGADRARIGAVDMSGADAGMEYANGAPTIPAFTLLIAMNKKIDANCENFEFLSLKYF